MVLDMDWLTVVDDYLHAIYEEAYDRRFQVRLAAFRMLR